jgi:hypothetical protein
LDAADAPRRTGSARSTTAKRGVRFVCTERVEHRPLLRDEHEGTPHETAGPPIRATNQLTDEAEATVA